MQLRFPAVFSPSTVTLVLLVFALGACGQRGPLYLPEEGNTSNPPGSAASSSAPAEEADSEDEDQQPQTSR